MPQVVSEDNCYHRGEGLKTWRQNLGKLTDFAIVMSPEYFDVLWVCWPKPSTCCGRLLCSGDGAGYR